VGQCDVLFGARFRDTLLNSFAQTCRPSGFASGSGLRSNYGKQIIERSSSTKAEAWYGFPIKQLFDGSSES
jgi:hypothetical protein